ncbi:hypothetical protein D3C72_1161640 [compost metagenome]
MLVRGHRAGQLVDGPEARNPKEFVEVEVAVIRLGRHRVGAQEHQLCTVPQLDVLALELDVHLFCEVNDVAAELVGLRLRGRQEKLVAPLFRS